MAAENFFEAVAVFRADVAEDDALMGSEPKRGPECFADFSEGRFQLHFGRVFDAAVFDVEAVEQQRVALLVPTHAVVETVDGDRFQRC